MIAERAVSVEEGGRAKGEDEKPRDLNSRYPGDDVD